MGRYGAFFSKETFVSPMCNNGFHVISRFRNDATLFYPTLEKPTKRLGHPKWYDGNIDFENLDLTRCTEYSIDKGKLYGLKADSKSLKRFVVSQFGIKMKIRQINGNFISQPMTQ